MTTIAWDGRTLAADQQRTNGNTCQRARKLFDCGDYAFAATGMMSEIPAICRWLEAGAPWNDRPECDGDDGGDAGLVVRKSDCALFLLQGKKTFSLIELPPGSAAAGSGVDFALAAMACGKDARGAVEIAILFDAGSGLGVDSVVVRAA
jgi:hypothetical protein